MLFFTFHFFSVSSLRDMNYEWWDGCKKAKLDVWLFQ